MSITIENVNEQITEEELQGLYMYLSLYFDDMTKEQKLTWIEIMQKLDKNFNETEI